MDIEIGTSSLVGFLLAMVRSTAWVMGAPPFATRVVPAQVKGIVAAALALPMAPRLSDAATLDTAGLVTKAVMQVAIGAGLGFLTLLVFSAVQAAGDLIDLFGGFQVAMGFDPL